MGIWQQEDLPAQLWALMEHKCSLLHIIAGFSWVTGLWCRGEYVVQCSLSLEQGMWWVEFKWLGFVKK